MADRAATGCDLLSPQIGKALDRGVLGHEDREPLARLPDGGNRLHRRARGDTPTPTLPRKRERERTVFAAIGKAKGGEMRGLRLKPGPLHLAAIVLAHLACMSLILWLSL
ncbi:hypothetical protein SAMN05216338_1001395 [Bradyrhizobium sp. Rc2d]|nr:hypothetical protein [Bradyrhizobium sp. Rc2d]SDG46296.1 hypothetical protein SAMN05216338_1001395 [Bradyrhizobium sp. Rc2d]